MTGLFVSAEKAEQQLSKYLLKNGKIRSCSFIKQSSPNKVRKLFDNMKKELRRSVQKVTAILL